MTPEYIAFHAAERPLNVAAVIGDRARALRLARGETLAVQCADGNCHWLILPQGL